MKLSLKEATLHLQNSYTRMPFRYGNACLTACPQATLRVIIEANGTRQAGYAGDMLPPGWFDKAPEKSYRQQIDEMIEVIDVARGAYLRTFEKPTAFFPACREAYQEVQAHAKKRGLPLLLGAASPAEPGGLRQRTAAGSAAPPQRFTAALAEVRVRFVVLLAARAAHGSHSASSGSRSLHALGLWA